MIQSKAEVPKVQFCGPIAAPGKPAKGGFQSCNRRTIDELRKRGVSVEEWHYAQPDGGALNKVQAYALAFSRILWSAFRAQPGTIFHLTGLFANFIYIELLFMKICRWRGCKCIFDLRAGSSRLRYERGNAAYRWAFARTLQSADLVLVEGEALMPFVQSLIGRPPVYFPNHLDTSLIAGRHDPAPSTNDAPVIAYAGSLKPEKGVESILAAAQTLRASGMKVTVRLAGVGPASFLETLKQRYADVPAEWLGSMGADKVLELFRNAHFFLFPTTHIGEGQSNALTEAMACGMVAIVSNHGFNASVVGPDGVVLPKEATAEAYAAALSRIWQQGEWPDLSRRARARIEQRFSSDQVVDRLVSLYRDLCLTP